MKGYGFIDRNVVVTFCINRKLFTNGSILIGGLEGMFLGCLYGVSLRVMLDYVHICHVMR